jgi:signal transduction histidine kinase
LYPPSLVSSGLLQSIKDLLAGVESKTEIKCKYKTEFFTENMLSQEEKLSVYRIVQECISNSLRHADAEEISITLKRKNLGFQLTYKDKSKHKVSKRLNPGFGLNTMKIRSESIGAKLHYFLQQEGFELGLFIPQQSKNKNHEQ